MMDARVVFDGSYGNAVLCTDVSSTGRVCKVRW
jgi:hypothetical protein